MDKYDIAMQAAEMSIDPIEIEGVTAENFEDKLAEQSIEVVHDDNGNPVAYYKDSLMSVVEPGKFSTSQKVQVYLKPTYNTQKSTPDNAVIDLNVVPAGSTTTQSGGQTIYMDTDTAFKNVMLAAGYDCQDIPAEIMNQMWEEYHRQEDDAVGNIVKKVGAGLIDGATHIPGMGESTFNALDLDKDDVALFMMKVAEFGDIKHPWIGCEDSNIARLLKAAAAVGLTDVGAIMEDDEETKAYFRNIVHIGDTVHLTAVGGRDGSAFDTDWVQAFIKPMTIATEATLGERAFPTLEQWENDYTKTSQDLSLIPVVLDNLVHTAVNKHINIWAATYCLNIDVTTANRGYVYLWGSYIDPALNWYVDNNQPELGFAELRPQGTFYNPNMFARWFEDHPAQFTAASFEGQHFPFLLVYDQERFYSYLATMTDVQVSNFINSYMILFSNGTVVNRNPYVEQTRPDALKIDINDSIADIIVQIEQDPVWPDNKITVPEYDPVTNTTVNKYYYPVTPNVEDPRVVNWPEINLPDIVNPINDIVKWPTIPSISLPVDNDPVTPTAGSNRFWTIYSPSDGQMQALGAELWDQNAIQILKQTFVNPTDGIITWQQVFLPVTQAYQDFIYLGDYKTGVDHVPVITQQKVFKEFGIIDIPRYFNDYRDYTETEVSMYLPFIGYVDIDPRDAIGCKLTLRYSMDVITGTCVATISPKVGDNAECCYMFTGNCAVQLPITAADRSRMLSGLISGASNGFGAGGKVGGLIGGGAGAGVGAGVGAVLGGALGAVSGYFGGVQKSNGFSANAGALTIYKTPFVIIHRSIPADPLLFDSYYGNPASVTATLKNLHGFTRVRECYIDIPTATDTEKQMIESYLKTGVILP